MAKESKELPVATAVQSKKTGAKKKNKELPVVGKAENMVLLGERMFEIKPTKLKYHRNNTASFYKIIEMIPLPDIMMMDKNAFGDGRDGDQALMDWLIAVTDDESLVREIYDDLTTDTIEKILAIFKRVNHISEKEEKQKNVESRMQRA